MTKEEIVLELTKAVIARINFADDVLTKPYEIYNSIYENIKIFQ